MLDEDLLDSLPEDSDEALAVLYNTLKSQLADKQERSDLDEYRSFDLESARRTMLNIVFAFIVAHELDVNANRLTPKDSEQFAVYFFDTTEVVEFYIAKTTFERTSRNRVGTSAIYVLPPELKARVHRYISSIREVIASSSLSDSKRSTLSKKLNIFAEEVDRNKTRIEALASAMIWTRKEIVEGAQGLEPIVEKLDKMFQSFTKATEFFRFPSKDSNQQLPSPPKRIEGPKTVLEEDVPF